KDVMKKSLTALLACALPCLILAGETKTPTASPAPAAAIVLREIRYDGSLTDDEARFAVIIDAEVIGKGDSSLKLFEGDVAVLPAKLPASLKIVRQGNQYLLNATRPGSFKF